MCIDSAFSCFTCVKSLPHFRLPCCSQILELRERLAQTTADLQRHASRAEDWERRAHDMEASRSAEVKIREGMAIQAAQLGAVHGVLRNSHEQLERERDSQTKEVRDSCSSTGVAQEHTHVGPPTCLCVCVHEA